MQNIKSILVPVDFSEGSKEAFRYALFLAEQWNASIRVLFVWQRPFYLGPKLVVSSAEGADISLEELASKEAQAELEKFIAKEKTSVPVTSQLVEGIIDTEIIRISQEGKFDLIVLGSHGESGRRHWILGSVAKRVVRSASCPVCVFKSPEGGDES